MLILSLECDYICIPLGAMEEFIDLRITLDLVSIIPVQNKCVIPKEPYRSEMVRLLVILNMRNHPILFEGGERQLIECSRGRPYFILE
jgi:hypothetical protein